MGFKIVWAPSSRVDLRNLVSYIAENDVPAAERMGLCLIKKIEQAAEFSASGRIVPEFGLPNIRELQIPPYRIIYRIKNADSIIEVVRVWHAARGKPNI